MILVDTNAWVHYISQPSAPLSGWLKDQRLVTTRVVLGELRLGSGVPPMLEAQLKRLPVLATPGDEAVLAFIERHNRKITATGVGWADVQIMIAGLNAGARLHSSDAPMRKAWRALGGRAA